MSSSVGAGAFLQGLAGGVGLGMQAQNMKQQNSNKPQQGSAVSQDALGMGLGALPVAAQKDPQAAGNASGMWGSLMKLVGG